MEYRESRANYLKQKPLLIVCKQKLFRFDESHRNQGSRRNNEDSSLDSRLDSPKIDSREDRESSVNLLLNGTVSVFMPQVCM